MAVILGIDAAWTPTGSSGVALLEMKDGIKGIVAAEPSYERFVAQGQTLTHGGSVPDVRGLLRACEKRAGEPVAVVAIDMPISRLPITGRRAADNDVSNAFGSAGASTHTPNADRPGQHGRDLMRSFEDAGYELVTLGSPTRKVRALIEVFPLASLVRLMALPFRPPYKVDKIHRYWRNEPRKERRRLLFEEWARIHRFLAAECEGCPSLPNSVDAPRASLKQYEDMLDATICALVGAHFVEGDIEGFGDGDATIWIPARNVRASATSGGPRPPRGG